MLVQIYIPELEGSYWFFSFLFCLLDTDCDVIQ